MIPMNTGGPIPDSCPLMTERIVLGNINIFNPYFSPLSHVLYLSWSVGERKVGV